MMHHMQQYLTLSILFTLHMSIPTQGSRILKGVDAMIRDSASMAVMIETIGSRNTRWLQRKRDDFITKDSSSISNHHRAVLSAGHRLTYRVSSLEGSRTSASVNMPSMVSQNSRLQHAVSSLSGSSGSSSNGSGSEEELRRLATKDGGGKTSELTNDKKKQASTKAKQVSSSSSGSEQQQQQHGSNNDFHDYHAPSLLDPLPESGGTSTQDSDSPDADMDSDNCVVLGKHMCTDSSSSSGDEEKTNPPKKSKTEVAPEPVSQQANASTSSDEPNAATGLSPIIAKSGIYFGNLPPNIAKSGISHSVMVTAPALPQHAGHAKFALSRAPKVALPTFAGLGKRKNKSSSSDDSSMVIKHHKHMPPILHQPHANNSSNTNSTESSSKKDCNIITIDNQSTSSSRSSSQNTRRGIQAHYYINEDDMIITDDVLMCPFIFRSQEAVWCGALAECVQPGMLRVSFSSTNKLLSVEMIFDAMGFCQQLERASGNEGMAQIIPNSLEMALAPSSEEARVITLAKHPFSIVSVNEKWMSVTGYTQLDAEGKELSILNGERTDSEAGVRVGMPPHDFENVAKGVCASSTNVHYDSKGLEFLASKCSYPLSNLNNEVTHILHVMQVLPATVDSR